MLKLFRCSVCQANQAFRVKFKRDKNKDVVAEIGWRVDPSTIPTPKPVGSGITIRPKAKSYRPNKGN